MTLVAADHEALYRLLTYARDEAQALSLPLSEYLLKLALDDLSETIQRRALHSAENQEREGHESGG